MAMAAEMTIKLLVDKKACKVLFAEGGKDVVDFIFTFLALPIGAALKLLPQDAISGSIVDLYKSVEALSTTYIDQGGKNFLLEPKIASTPRCNKQPLLLPHLSSANDSLIYTCSNYHCNRDYYSDAKETKCGSCSSLMGKKITYVPPSTNLGAVSGEEGFVKGVVTYMLMDDLSVSPMSSISSIALLTKFDIKDLSVLEERVVKVGIDEGLELLQASFKSKTALTSVFLKSMLKISTSST